MPMTRSLPLSSPRLASISRCVYPSRIVRLRPGRPTHMLRARVRAVCHLPCRCRAEPTHMHRARVGLASPHHSPPHRTAPPHATPHGLSIPKIKNIELDGKRIKLQIWDTAGQERFRTITTSYFRGAQGILLVYDVTDRGSFNSIRNWVGQIQQHADVHVNKILIGNKCDIEDQRMVSKEEGEKLAKEYDIKFFETSAKQDFQVDSGFVTIAGEVKNRLISEGAPAVRNNNHIKAGAGGGGKKKSGCC
mmetsp:Transcript_37507/g.101644  ORF Transcript_37507/g.101644 Transcript_37507/m.101644 type:complete len:248 (-) Transcript_37507:178-921(-)